MVKFNFSGIWVLLCLMACFELLNAQQLITYPGIPGRATSDKYRCRVRQVGSDDWKEAFVLQTMSKPEITVNGQNVSGYKKNLLNWSASWLSFEFSGNAVEVEISKVSGASITKAMVRPVGDAGAATLLNGKAYVVFNKPANVNVDIDGQMEDRYTGMGYTGPPVHTISLFANPIFVEPDTTKANVLTLNPGEAIPADRTTWDTIYFKPGIHRIGTPFQIKSNEVLYIPGNAVVHGTIHPPDAWGNNAAMNWAVYGSGTLSSEEIPRNTATKDNKPFTYQAAGVRLEGFVIADPAHHAFNMNCTKSDTLYRNVYKNLKILGWRINGDGINAFNNSEITNCFFRTQDDLFYYGGNGVKISNCVTWNDYNGSVLYVTKGSDVAGSSYFKDCKVIYHRAGWHYWNGGRVISFRDRKPGDIIKNVLIKNVLIEDPFPAFAPFFGIMYNPDSSAAGVNFSNIIIENVRQEHPAVPGNLDANYGKSRNTLRGLDNTRKFSNITFRNCYYNGKWLGSFGDGDFLKNNFIENISFVLDSVNQVVSLQTNDTKRGSVSRAGSGEQESNKSILLYFDRASGFLIIGYTTLDTQKVQLFDTMGKLLYSETTNNNRINLNGFTRGMYVVRLTSNGRSYNLKVIK